MTTTDKQRKQHLFQDSGHIYVGEKLGPTSDDAHIIALSLKYQSDRGSEYKPIQYTDEQNRMKLGYVNKRTVLLQLFKDIFEKEMSKKKQAIFCELPLNYHQIKNLDERIKSIKEHNRVTLCLPKMEDLSNSDPRFLPKSQMKEFLTENCFPNTPVGHFYKHHHHQGTDEQQQRVVYCRKNKRPFIVEIKNANQETKHGARTRKKLERYSKTVREIQRQFQKDVEEIDKNEQRYGRLLDERMLGLTWIEPKLVKTAADFPSIHREQGKYILRNNNGKSVRIPSEQQLIHLIIRAREKKNKRGLEHKETSIRVIMKSSDKEKWISFLVFPGTPNAIPEEDHLYRVLRKPMKFMGLNPDTPFMIKLKRSTYDDYHQRFRQSSAPAHDESTQWQNRQEALIGTKSEAIDTDDIRRKIIPGMNTSSPPPSSSSFSNVDDGDGNREGADDEDLSYSEDEFSSSSGDENEQQDQSSSNEKKFKVLKFGKKKKFNLPPGMEDLDPSRVGFVRTRDGLTLPYEIENWPHFLNKKPIVLRSDIPSRRHKRIFRRRRLFKKSCRSCEDKRKTVGSSFVVSSRASLDDDVCDHCVERNGNSSSGNKGGKLLRVTWKGPDNCLVSKIRKSKNEVVHIIGDFDTENGRSFLSKFAQKSHPDDVCYIYKNHDEYSQRQRQ